MEPNFWLERWADGRTGFHNQDVNPHLKRHYPEIDLPDQAHIFVPLCGKTRDIPWLRAQGCRVTGIELSQLAVEQLFEEMGVEPVVKTIGKLARFQNDDVTVYCGDFFDLTPQDVGAVDLIYDRAALIALPEDMRHRYAQHVLSITGTAPQLLITLTYDPATMNGPPFCVPHTETEVHYGASYEVTALHSSEVTDSLRDRVEATEHVWHLTPR